MICLLVLAGTCVGFGQNYALQNSWQVNPYLVNPANAISDYTQVFSAYRTQWLGMPGAPKFISVGGNTLLNNTHAGIGFKATNFTRGFLTTNDFSASFAYGIPVNTTSKLFFGLSGGLLTQSINWNLVTDDDANDPLLNSFGKAAIPSVAFGMLYKNSSGFNFGVSMPQLIRSQELSTNFQIQPDNLIVMAYFSNWAPHTAVKSHNHSRRHAKSLKDGFPLEVYSLYRYTQSGGQAEVFAKFNTKAAWVSVGYRQAFGVIPGVGFNLGKLSLQYTYEPGLGGDIPLKSHELVMLAKLGEKKLFKGDKGSKTKNNTPPAPKPRLPGNDPSITVKNTNNNKSKNNQTASVAKNTQTSGNNPRNRPTDTNLGTVTNPNIQTEEKKPVVETKPEEKKPPVVTQTEEKKPVVETKTEEKKPPVVTKTEEKKPVVETKTEEKKPPVVTQTEEKKPVVETKTEEKKPPVVTQTEEKKPVIETKTEEKKPPVVTQTEEKKPVVETKTEEKKPPVVTQTEEKKPVIETKTEEKKPPVVTQTEEKKPVVETKTELKKPPVVTQTEEKKPVVETKTEEKKPPVVTQTEEKKPVVETKTEEKKPPVVTQTEEKKPVVETKPEEKKPPVVTQTEEKKPVVETKPEEKKAAPGEVVHLNEEEQATHEEDVLQRLDEHSDNPTEEHVGEEHPHAERHEFWARGDHEKELEIGHYVIVGVFKSEANAKRVSDGYRNLGFAEVDYGFQSGKGFWFVHIAGSEDMDVPEAGKLRNKYRKMKMFRDAWLLTVHQ